MDHSCTTRQPCLYVSYYPYYNKFTVLDEYCRSEYEYESEYLTSEYEYKYEYFKLKYEYKYKYQNFVLEYYSSTSTSNEYYISAYNGV